MEVLMADDGETVLSPLSGKPFDSFYPFSWKKKGLLFSPHIFVMVTVRARHAKK